MEEDESDKEDGDGEEQEGDHDEDESSFLDEDGRDGKRKVGDEQSNRDVNLEEHIKGEFSKYDADKSGFLEPKETQVFLKESAAPGDLRDPIRCRQGW